MNRGEPALIIRRLWMDGPHFRRADVEPGYEVLAAYVTSDLHGIESSPYVDVRRLAEAGLRGEPAGDYTADSYNVEVDGDLTTVTALYRQDEQLTLSTRDFLEALDAYARFMDSVE